MWGLWRAPAAAGPCSLNMDQGGGLRDPSFSRWLGKQGPPLLAPQQAPGWVGPESQGRLSFGLG